MSLGNRVFNVFELLASETFFVIDLFSWLVATIHFAKMWHGRLLTFMVCHNFCSLNRFRAAVLKALYALLPGLEMQLMQVSFMNIGRQEQIDRL